MFRVRLKYYSVFTYYSLWTNVGRPSLSVALFFLGPFFLSVCCGGECEGGVRTRAVAAAASARAGLRPRWREGAGGEVRWRTRWSGQQPWRGSTPWRRTRRVAGLLHRHRVDLAMAVEEARSGPGGVRTPLRGGSGRPRWRGGTGGEVRSRTRRSGQ